MTKWNHVNISFILFIFIISLTGLLDDSMAASIRRTPEVESALKWLKGQFEPSTALPQSYENPTDAAAWTYDVATWITVMTQAGEIELATKVTQTLLQLQSDGAWVDGYNIINRAPITTRQSVGPNAWMGLALCHYFLATNENEALEGALRVADWLLRLQNVIPEPSPSYGAIPGGLDEAGVLIQWISVEHNADALAFFYAIRQITGEEKYSDAAKRIANWMVTRLWNPAESHFEVGTLDLAGTVNKEFPEHLDTQTWTILAIDATANLTGLQAKAFNGLSWIHPYETTVEYNGKTVQGFATKTFGPGSQSFWSEGTAGYGLAAMTIGDGEAATFYASQIHRLQTQNGGIPYSVAPDDVAQAYPQKWDFNAIAAATWMIWLDSGINPFVVVEKKSTATYVLIVTGTIYEADGKTVVSETLSVTVQNIHNQMMGTDETGRYAETGQYVVTLVSLDDPAARVEDLLEVTVTRDDGRQIAQKRHALTPAEIQNSYVQMDVTLAPPLPAWDVNADGVVNVFDLVLVGSQFGLSGADLKGDANGDGLVNVFDLVIVSSHFGENTVAAAPFRDDQPTSEWANGLEICKSANLQICKFNASRHTPYAIEPIRQAIRALEAMPNRPHGATLALQLLRAFQADTTPVPLQTRLLPNYPNPFNP